MLILNEQIGKVENIYQIQYKYKIVKVSINLKKQEDESFTSGDRVTVIDDNGQLKFIKWYPSFTGVMDIKEENKFQLFKEINHDLKNVKETISYSRTVKNTNTDTDSLNLIEIKKIHFHEKFGLKMLRQEEALNKDKISLLTTEGPWIIKVEKIQETHEIKIMDEELAAFSVSKEEWNKVG
ncbi:hypothetical protein RCL_jg9279.t1 [Rhizophagus clarus]|uniref:Uncharacterized protein n=1 Tax=Rhizophagus clarus TaxID=94130 RepID=A0A8H3M507_9GLOM|nr:hypothetical protein RCL_jg9279.t1 [Rhizophagus clarus]